MLFFYNLLFLFLQHFFVIPDYNRHSRLRGIMFREKSMSLRPKGEVLLLDCHAI